ncbi:MAG TPA: hypothetical protein VMW58_03095 [Anaerolineae bacterium]|nr:hypothetical protein [Anaerolineae bacterium]
MSDFLLTFDLAPYHRLDRLALLACQDYNLGNVTDWFGSFRGGLAGLESRTYGVQTHFRLVHAWLPTRRSPLETEYHIASIFFNMDSAIECLAFALNALGFAVAPKCFRDVTDERQLTKIAPWDVSGRPTGVPPRQPLDGYKLVFPALQAHWQANRGLLDTIVEQHDVSKHREHIFEGGMARLDPPVGFYEALGIADDKAKQHEYWPMAEIILREAPKRARGSRTPQSAGESVVLLETVSKDFCDFINQSGWKALEDAVSNIHLPYTDFLDAKTKPTGERQAD